LQLNKQVNVQLNTQVNVQLNTQVNTQLNTQQILQFAVVLRFSWQQALHPVQHQ
jgi:hypothetical protein